MPRYRLITPHGIYASGTILDTDLPAGRPFRIEEPAARRLAELGVMEPLDPEQEPQVAADEPGWSQGSARAVRLDAASAARGERRAATAGRDEGSRRRAGGKH